MKIKSLLGWRIYFVIVATILIGNLLSVLSCRSVVYTYYHSLIAFHKDFIVFYYFNILSAVINVLSLMPLFCYIYRRRFLRPRLWQVLFCLRIAFDFVDHNYETRFFQSLFKTDLAIALILLSISLLVILPSYFATFQYAFRQHRLFPQ